MTAQPRNGDSSSPANPIPQTSEQEAVADQRKKGDKKKNKDQYQNPN